MMPQEILIYLPTNPQGLQSQFVVQEYDILHWCTQPEK